MNAFDILEYRHDKLQEHLWRIEERHDAQLKALEAEVVRLKADLAAVVERLNQAHQAPEE